MDAVFNQRFDEAVNADMPTLVMFHSPDNKRSVSELPAMEKTADEYGGRAHFFIVDRKVSPDLCRKYGIRRYPAFILFTDGIEAWRSGGHIPREELEGMVRRFD